MTQSLCLKCGIHPQSKRSKVAKGQCCNQCPNHGPWCTSVDTKNAALVAPEASATSAATKRAVVVIAPQANSIKRAILVIVPQANSACGSKASSASSSSVEQANTSAANEPPHDLLETAPQQSQDDCDAVLAALQDDHNALLNASPRLRADTMFMLQAVRKDGLVLEFATREQRLNTTLVLAALRQNILSLEYVPDKLWYDRSFVLEAVQINTRVLCKVPRSLREDKEFMSSVVRCNPFALLHVGGHLREDQDFALDAIKANPVAITCVPDEFVNDHPFMLRAIHVNIKVLRYVPALCRDASFMVNALSYTQIAWSYVPEGMLNDHAFMSKVRCSSLSQDGPDDLVWKSHPRQLSTTSELPLHQTTSSSCPSALRKPGTTICGEAGAKLLENASVENISCSMPSSLFSTSESISSTTIASVDPIENHGGEGFSICMTSRPSGERTFHCPRSHNPDQSTSLRSQSGSSLDPEARDQFLRFLQCQLQMEATHCLGVQSDNWPDDADLVDSYRKFANLVTPARCEKWVPVHICFGSHDRFILDKIYNSHEAVWDERRHFFLMFLFRAHCCSQTFEQAQRSLVLTEEFWRDPESACAPNGAMEQIMLEYRRRTGNPLQTAAFRIIPRRLCDDRDENLVRNICTRTSKFMVAAEECFNYVQDTLRKLDGADAASFSEELHCNLLRSLRKVDGVGDTWAKMLVVSIGIRYPQLNLVQSACEVGVGAIAALKRLFPDGSGSFRDQLSQLTVDLRNHQIGHPEWGVWKELREVERTASKIFTDPLFRSQLMEARNGISAGTLQVQLCEWRQFGDFCAQSERLQSPSESGVNSLDDKTLGELASRASVSHGQTPSLQESKRRRLR